MDIIGEVEYRAVGVDGKVSIFAAGLNPTPDYHIGMYGGLRHFQLMTNPPSGPVSRVVTMFSICQEFEVDGSPSEIEIEDFNGVHVVPVTTLDVSLSVAPSSDTKCGAYHQTHGGERCGTRCTKLFSHRGEGTDHVCGNGHGF